MRGFCIGSAAIVGALALGTGGGDAAPVSHILVSDAWSRATPQGLPTGVAYMTLTNPSAAPVRLRGAATPVARRMELHLSSMRAGVMSMTDVPEGVAIPAGGHVSLAPGGYHFMLVGLKGGLAAGSTFPVTLDFADGPRLKVEVMVRTAPPGPASAGMKMP